MNPIAALRHETLLLILFGWEFEGSRRYALNMRDATDEDMQLAWEIVRPMKLDPEKVAQVMSEAESDTGCDEDFQEAVICGLIEEFDVLEHFSSHGKEAPESLKNLIGLAKAMLEGAQLSVSIAPVNATQVRVSKRV